MRKFISILFLCTIAEAIQSIRPKAEWALQGDTYSGLVWLDKTQTKPTKSEITQAISDCQTADVAAKAAREQAILDANNTTKTPQERIDALIKVIDLK